MTIRVGFLGAGFIARYHAMQLRLAAEPNEIVAVHDPDRAKAESFVADEGGQVHSGVEAVIDASDVVFVCTWTAAHLGCVRRIVAAGRPVFCEKPLSTDLASATEVFRTVDDAGALNAVGLVLRTSPALLAFRELIADPSSGAVMNVVFRDDQYLPTQGMYASTWRGDVALAGSGALIEHSIHDLDILEWLIGDIATVGAQQSHFHGIDGIEDSVSVLVRFAGGATATLASVWHDVLSRPSQRRIEVFCERAVVTLEGDLFGPVRVQRSDDELEIEGEELVDWLAERGVALESTEQAFLAAAAAGSEQPSRVRPDVSDALRAHVLVDAVYRSADADGQTIAVPGRVGANR